MALIQKLRASGVVVGAVVVALIAFVATDAIKSGGNNRAQDENLVAQIGGEDIQMDDFNAIANKFYQKEMEQIPTDAERQKKFKEVRDRAFQSAWSELLSKNTMEKAISNSGIEVTDIDVKEMFLGDNPSDVSQDPSFMDNGVYSKSKVREIFRSANRDKRLKSQLLDFTDRIKKQTAAQRYSAYVANTLHNTTAEKEYEYLSANEGTTGSIVSVNYASVLDADIKITDKDYESYYKDHKYLYRQNIDERDIEFVIWDVVPSKSDSSLAQEMAIEKAEAYAQDGENDTLGGGVTPGYVSSDIFASEFKEDTVKRDFYAKVFASEMGSVHGPLYNNGSYLVGRKVKESENPDPIVDVSHILISTSSAIQNKIPVKDSIEAKSKAYGLLAQLRSGANFEELAKQFSADAGSGAQGGVLDPKPVSNFVPGFADFCKENNKGSIGVAKSQFGYHIIKVNNDPQRKLAKLRVEEVEILPSSEITKSADKASTKFVNALDYKNPNSFKTAQKKFSLTPRIVKDISTTTKEIIGLTDKSDSRQIVNWLFNNKRATGDISNVFQFRDKYIVVHVTSARNRGYAEWQDIKSKMEPEVRKEVKAKIIMAKIKKHYVGNIKAEDLANKIGGVVIPIENFKASQNFLPQLTKDDKVLGALIGTSVKESSIPVAGVQGVAIVYVKKRDKVSIPKAGLGENDQFGGFNNSDFVLRRLDRALYNQAEVQDYRFRQDIQE